MMSQLKSEQAADIARRFFEQYHSSVESKKVIWDNDSWLVQVDIGFLTEKIRIIRIDPYTGRIIELVNESHLLNST